MSVREDLLYMLLPSGSSEGAGWGKYPDTWLECPVPSGNAINILIADNVPYNTGSKQNTVTLYIDHIAQDSGEFTATVYWGDGTSDYYYSGDADYEFTVEHTYAEGSGHIFYEGCEQWLISVVIEGNGTVWQLNNGYMLAICSGNAYNYGDRYISYWYGNHNTIQYINAQGDTVPAMFAQNLNGLHYIDAPNLIEIPSRCVFNCHGLLGIKAPKTQNISDDAFNFCYGLQYVTVSAECDVSGVALNNCYSFVKFIQEE